MRGVLLLLAILLGGCESLSYYAQSAQGQLAVSCKARALNDVLQDERVLPAHKKRLQRAQAMLRFAQQELDLPAGYERYVDVGREALVWSIVATPRFSLQPKQWCYPVIGCASYRGYFSKQAALQYAAKLKAEGWDVAVERVPAYSTLGWFDDPIPSTVIDWPEAEFAGLLFHELAHQKVYAKGDSAFNESYARVVEYAGIERWLGRLPDAQQQLAAWRLRQQRAQQFNAMLYQTQDRLRDLYAQSLPESMLAQRKHALFERLQADYQQLRARWGGYAGYDGWMQRPLNNAYLASTDTYSRWQSALQQLLQDVEGAMPDFHRRVKALAETEQTQRTQRLQALACRASCAPRVGVMHRETPFCCAD